MRSDNQRILIKNKISCVTVTQAQAFALASLRTIVPHLRQSHMIRTHTYAVTEAVGRCYYILPTVEIYITVKECPGVAESLLIKRHAEVVACGQLLAKVDWLVTVVDCSAKRGERRCNLRPKYDSAAPVTVLLSPLSFPFP